MKKNTSSFPLDKEIELVAVKNGVVKKKIMNYGEALKTPKKKGWRYIYYQLGFCSM